MKGLFCITEFYSTYEVIQSTVMSVLDEGKGQLTWFIQRAIMGPAGADLCDWLSRRVVDFRCGRHGLAADYGAALLPAYAR